MIHNPEVPGSSPGLATKISNELSDKKPPTTEAFCVRIFSLAKENPNVCLTFDCFHSAGRVQMEKMCLRGSV